MYCRSCGEEISDTEERCPCCGAYIGGSGGSGYGSSSDDLDSYDGSDYWSGSGSDGDPATGDDGFTVNLYDNSDWKPAKKKKSILPLLLGILAAILLISAIAGVICSKQSGNTNEDVTQPLEQVGYKQVCKFTVRTEGDEICYVYMEYIGEPTYSTEKREALGGKGGNPNVAFLVYPGKDSVIYMPIGKYTMYYAEGEKWINVEEKFGPDTEMFCADYVWEFYKTAAGYYTEDLTMNSKSGNIDIFGVDASDFPNEITDEEVVK